MCWATNSSTWWSDRSRTSRPIRPSIPRWSPSSRREWIPYILAVISKFAAQAIRKVFDIGWKPLFFMGFPASSIGMVIKPAGPEKAVGIITAFAGKDPIDPAWNGDPGMQEWRVFMAKYLPDADLSDSFYVAGYGQSLALMQVLKQCG